MFWNMLFRAPAPATRTNRPVRARLEVESLQERVLPSTSPVMLDAAPAAAHKGAAVAGKAHQHFTFALTGAGKAKGRAQAFVVRTDQAITLNKLALHIQRAPKAQTFSVFIDDADKAAGQIKTNRGGAGKVFLTKLNVAVKNGSILKVVDADGDVVMQGTFRIPPRRG